MVRFRLSRLARADLARILAISAERWGAEDRRRYSALIAIAMRQVANDPEGRATRGRDDLLRGVRSFHIRHIRASDLKANVKKPVHILYYRAVAPGLVEIVRVLHEHMEPSHHVGQSFEE
jgi:toxin ParE1/3/4